MNNSITVAVGSPDNLRSAIWRLWVQGDEIYFGAAPMLRSLKVSLHKSGDWRIAWIEPSPHERNKDRNIRRWRRPADTGSGIIGGVAVVIDPLLPKEPFTNKAILNPDIKWLPPALYGRALVLHVLIATKKADLDSGRFKPTQRIIARLKKANGEFALLLVEDATFTAEMKQKIVGLRSDIRIHLGKAKSPNARVFDQTRMFSISDVVPNHVPTIFDMSLGWENVVFDEKWGPSQLP